MSQSAETRSKVLGLVWVSCSHSVTSLGLVRALEGWAHVHVGQEAPEEVPSLTIVCAGKVEDVPEGVGRVREVYPDALVLVFGPNVELPLARAAFQAGTRGFIHAEMPPDQVVRAVTVAASGQPVAPRDLLLHLIAHEDPVNLNILSGRQREILELVVDGLSNAQIATRLFLSESTIKQHLRAAYKLLGVKNRTEAAALMRGT